MTGPDVGDRVDYGLAQLCAVVASSSMGTKRSFRASDFMPRWGQSEVSQSNEEVLEMFRQLKARTDG